MSLINCLHGNSVQVAKNSSTLTFKFTKSMKKIAILVCGIYASISVQAQNTGVGTTNPLEFFSVGASSQFRVNASGDIVRIRNVQYSFPSVQGSVGSVLMNDGNGNLEWNNVTTVNITASGTPSSSTFLRGDGSWATVSGGGSGATMVSDFTDNTVTNLPGSTETTIQFSGNNCVNGVFTAPSTGIYLFTFEFRMSSNAAKIVKAILNNSTTVYSSLFAHPNQGNNPTTYVFVLSLTSGNTITMKAYNYGASFDVQTSVVRIVKL